MSLKLMSAVVAADWGRWIRRALSLAIGVALIKALFGSYVPFGYWEFWQQNGQWQDWLIAGWPMLVWGIVISGISSLLTSNNRAENDNAEALFLADFNTSVRAGVMEEIIFRWLLLMTAILATRISDFILGGFIFGRGFVWLLQSYIVMPVVNLLSMGMLSEWLSRPECWFVAAAIIVANTKFRDGHKYQGPIGLANSWFIGLFLFHIMFRFGLPAAILLHLLYDVFIDVVRYVDRAAERQKQKRR